ncbi:MAG: bifunctional adenosylcobinamide kinase/adenosylcobinamide-phosphate guanylyltransferase [Pseudomonadota bacterium]
MALPSLSLVIGGAASGKSDFAESLVLKAGQVPLYIATAQVFDAEMAAKVDAHKEARGEGWVTIEAPIDVAGALQMAESGQPVLIDCATLWLTNLILGEHDVETATDGLIMAVRAHGGPVVIVTNEVGYGIVPENALSRRFRTSQGQLNQRLAAEADLVVTVIAGLPLALKGQLP